MCLIEKGRNPVAVLISLADYRKRFVDFEADIARRKIIDEIKSSQIKLPAGVSSLSLIQDLRRAGPGPSADSLAGDFAAVMNYGLQKRSNVN